MFTFGKLFPTDLRSCQDEEEYYPAIEEYDGLYAQIQLNTSASETNQQHRKQKQG